MGDAGLKLPCQGRLLGKCLYRRILPVGHQVLAGREGELGGALDPCPALPGGLPLQKGLCRPSEIEKAGVCVRAPLPETPHAP